jgi:hypothetical protein
MTENDDKTGKANGTMKLALARLAGGVPLAWGIVETIKKTRALFGAA